MSKDKTFQITHLGAEIGVTGSCHLIQARGLNILVDCGMAQGKDTVLPIDTWPVRPSDIDFVFLTHAHIDHIGRLPFLIMHGFEGEIITTFPTKYLILPMLEDAMALQDFKEKEITRLTQELDELSWGFEYDEDFDLKKGIRFRMGRAGHILGSCFIRFEVNDPPSSVIFSGDIGGRDRPLVPDPDLPSSCDLLILESTYGGTVHEKSGERTRRLGSILSKALSDGSKVFIPSFALGRTQELLYEMERFSTDPDLKQAFPLLAPETGVPVFLDSPLGLKITEIYTRLYSFWDEEAKRTIMKGDHPLEFSRVYSVPKHKEHLELLDMAGPAIIIAGNGMCTGGRIIDHLKTGLEDPKNDILFVGYQAEGTPGRAILEHGNKPDGFAFLDGEKVLLRAAVHALTGYSAHADREGLMDWVRSMPARPGRIKLVHGEVLARRHLSEALRSEGYTVDTTE